MIFRTFTEEAAHGVDAGVGAGRVGALVVVWNTTVKSEL